MIANLAVLTLAAFLSSSHEIFKADFSLFRERNILQSNGMSRRFQNKATEECLDAGPNGSVLSVACNRGLSQAWERNERFRLKNRQTQECLEMSKKGVVFTKPCRDSESQDWSPVPFIFEPDVIRNSETELCINSNITGARCSFADDFIWTRLEF